VGTRVTKFVGYSGAQDIDILTTTAGGGVGAGQPDEVGERRGKAIERLLGKADLLGRDGGGLGAVREAQRDDAEARGQLRRDDAHPGGVPRRRHEGDGVAAPRQTLGELEKRDHVAERQPWEHHDVQMMRRRRAAFMLLGFCHGCSCSASWPLFGAKCTRVED